MTDLPHFLQSLYQQGITLWPAGDQLAFDGPEPALTPALLNQLKAQKRAILRHLQTTVDAPLAVAQKGLWFLQQSAPNSAAYHAGVALRIHAPVEVELLHTALQLVVNRHAALRTTFPQVDHEPVQRIAGYQPVAFTVCAAEGWSTPQLQAAVLAAHAAPFDLAHGPIFRAQLFTQQVAEQFLLISAHHIAVDAWSLYLILDELGRLYAALLSGDPATLPTLTQEYTDFVHWQGDRLTRDGERLWTFWRDNLAGDLSVLALPTDRPRPPLQSLHGLTLPVQLTVTLTSQLRQLAQAHHCTLSMLLLAAYQVLLYRYSGQADLLVGLPMAGRNRTEFVEVVGYFATTVVLRASLDDQLPFTHWLAQVRRQMLAALDHQDYPFPLLVERLQPTRDLSRAPLVQTQFVVQKPQRMAEALARTDPAHPLNWGGLPVSRFDLPLFAGQVDLTLELWDLPTGLEGSFKYDSALFDAGTIQRLADHWQTLLAAIVGDPTQLLGALPLLSTAEHQSLLAAGQPTHHAAPPEACLHERFAQQAARTPTAVALVYEEERLTYADLNRQANQLAHYLRQQGAGPETIVGLCVERSPLLVIGILGILKAGAAYLPLDPTYPSERLAFMLNDAQAPLLLTQTHLAATWPPQAATVICLDQVAAQLAQAGTENPSSGATAANLAYVIYTSGSTGQPKGVLIEHQNVLRLFTATTDWFHFNEQDVWTLFHSYAFDFSVWELWGALLYGGRLVVVPYWVSRAPAAFYKLLQQEGVTVLSQTPSAFRQLMTVEAAQDTASALALRLVIFGGEALNIQSLQPWFARHGDQHPQLVNMYGITETTVHVTYRPLTRADLDRPGSLIGRPIPDLALYILDAHQQPTPIGVAGELYVGGAGLARGYLHQPALTQAKFIDDPFAATPGSRLYRSGDLGRYVLAADGVTLDIEYLGRLDNQVKVRGFRIELGEIEACLQQHPAVRTCAVIARSAGAAGQQLLAYVVPAVEPDPDRESALGQELRDFLRQRLPDYMVPVHFGLLAALPLTANGKLNLRALPAPADQPVVPTTPPRTPLEAAVAELWAELLQRSAVGIDENFFDLGGHSLLVTQIIARIRTTWGVEIGVREFFEQPTVAALAAAIAAGLSSAPISPDLLLQPYPRTGPLPLSFAQQRLWFLDQLGSGAAYNVPVVLQLNGRLVSAALEQALQRLVERHEILRTTYQAIAGQPYQITNTAAALALPVVDLQQLPEDERAAAVQRWTTAIGQQPFDLSCDLPLRARLLWLGPEHYQLLITLHHIAVDGWSLAILVRELAAFYAAAGQEQAVALPALPIQYADFAQWQRHWLPERVQHQLAYWQEQLAGAPPLLALPLASDRPATPRFQGSVLTFAIAAAVADQVRQLSRQQQATPFMTLLAAFKLLLARYSGQHDLVVGTVVANRQQQALEPLIGFFANTLALRTALSGDLTFITYLDQVRQVTQAAYAHQDLPFEQVVEGLQLARDPRYNPLVQVLFVLQNTPPAPMTLGAVQLSRLTLAQAPTARFDLELHLEAVGETFQGYWVYNRELFAPATMARMVEHFQRLLGALVTQPTQPLATIALLNAAEQQEQLAHWRALAATPTAFIGVHTHVERQAAQLPDNVAIVADAATLTYAELNGQANQLAHYLRTLGVAAGAPVLLVGSPAAATAVAMLATLKAGGSYAALATDYPATQVPALLAQLAPQVILTIDAATAGWLHQVADRLDQPVVCLATPPTALAAQSTLNPSVEIRPEQLAYCCWANGQWVEVEQQALSRRVQWYQQHFTLTSADAVLYPAAGLGDDLGCELLWPLCYGARLVLATATRCGQPAALCDCLAATGTTIVQLTPPALAGWLDHLGGPAATRLPTLCWVLVSGEPLPTALAQRFLTQFTARLGYLYRLPATGVVAFQEGQPEQAGATISGGLPTDLCAPCLLDEHGQLVPLAGEGEIYVAGPGLARNADSASALGLIDAPAGGLYQTGDRGRWRADGTLEVLGAWDRHAWIAGTRVDLAAVEVALLGDPAVAACAVAVQTLANGLRALVAYVAPTGALAPARLQTHLQATLPAAWRPGWLVPISTLPLTAQGAVDQAALLRLPLIDEQVAQQVEARLQTLPAITQVAVQVEEAPLALPPLHLSDLLPPTSHPAAPPSVKNGGGPTNSRTSNPAPLAFSDGGSLAIPVDAPLTLTAALLRTAACAPERGIHYIQSDGSVITQSYAALLAAAHACLTGLVQLGLRPGDKVILQIAALDDYFPVFWGCVLGGIIPVTIAIPPHYAPEQSVVGKLYHTWALLEQPPILASDELVAGLRELEQSLHMPGLQVCPQSGLRHHLPTTPIHQSEPDAAVFLQLTSGSTGAPKAIQETHRGIISHIHGSSQANRYQPSDITLNWLPLDHVVPLLTFHLKDVYWGCQQVQAPTAAILAEPLRWLDLLEQYRVTHTWAPNFGYKLVSDQLAHYAHRRWDLAALKRCMNAGEQVTLPVVRDFLQRVAPFGVTPQVMQPAFGMAEVCTCMTYHNEFTLEAGVHWLDRLSLAGALTSVAPADPAAVSFIDLGGPIPGVQLRIVDAENQLLPERVIGRLQIRGAVVTPGYYRHPAANQAAFVGDGWFNTGDLGFLDQGRLTITGREKEMIILRGANYYCYEIEEIVSRVPGVLPTYVAACALPDPGTGSEELALFVVPTVDGREPPAALVNTIRSQVATTLGINPAVIVPMAQAAFPKTTSGKIQRTQLKNALLAGAFQTALKELDLALQNERTLPAWFYRKRWQRQQIHTERRQLPAGTYLVFLDEVGLGAALCTALTQAQRPCVRVEASTTFAKVAERHYCLTPDNPDHYQRLLADLLAQDLRPAQVIHLWLYSTHQGEVTALEALTTAQSLGLYSLLYLVQALAQPGAAAPLGLTVVTSYTHQVISGEAVAYAKAPALGLLKTIPQELPWLAARQIDLQPTATPGDLERLLAELTAVTNETPIAYRSGQRWCERLEPVRFTEQPAQALPFKPGGRYLLSGGLGGIGLTVARYLLEHYAVHLLVLGRTPLPDDTAADNAVAQRLASLRNWAPNAEAVRYAAVDLALAAADPTPLQAAVTAAQQAWGGPLDGVIHLAGCFHEGLLTTLTGEELAATLAAKVQGSWALYQLLKDRPDVLFLHFASVNGHFGGVGVGAYAAANSFVTAFADFLQTQGWSHSYCYSWSMWDEVGMSRGYGLKDLTRKRGFQLINARQGLQALLAGLAHRQPHLLIGLDGSSQRLRGQSTHPTTALQQLTAYLSTSAAEQVAAQITAVTLQDPGQRPLPLTVMTLPALPLTPLGAIDRAQLQGLTPGRRRGGVQVAPRTPLEQQVATIWQKVLGLSQVSIHDNFFTLGGDSLLATQLVAQVQGHFGVTLALHSFFEAPTVAGLAHYLEIIAAVTQSVERVDMADRELVEF